MIEQPNTQEPPKAYKGPSMDLDAWEHEFYGGVPEAEPTSTPGQQKVHGFWDRLVHGVEGKSRVAEIGRSAVRGVVEAGAQTINTVEEGLNMAGKAVGAPTIDPGGKQKREAAITDFLGARSDDPIASFTEGVFQFVPGFVGLGKLKWGGEALGALKGAKGFVSALTRGAAVDFSAFDPYEQGLSELVARAPIPVARELGQMLSVEADDPAYVARLKRTAEGAISGVALDALLAMGKVVRGKKILSSGDTKPAARTAAEAQIAEAEATLKNINEGTHVPEGDAVTVAEKPEGGFELKGAESESPVFTDRAEAEAQASTLNMAASARKRATLSETETSEILNVFQGISRSTSQEELLQTLTERGNFNMSYMMEPQEVMSLMESISSRMSEALDKVQKHPDGISVEESFGMARKALGAMEEWEAPQIVAAALGDRANHVWTLTGHMVLRDRGAQLVKISHLLEARPHDLVLHEELRSGLGKYYDLMHALAGANSETGRTLRILQERSNPLMEDFSYKQIGSGEKPAVEIGTTKKTAREMSAERFGLQFVAGMEPRDLRATARLLRMAGDNPRNLIHVAQAIQTVKLEGWGNKVMEVFANNLLSAPTTSITALVSGVSTSWFEAFGKLLGGTATGNGKLAREGADLMFGYFTEALDGIKAAGITLRSGQSTINPHPAKYAIGGVTGQAIRLPGRVLLATDELVRTTVYRSYVRAKALREGRSLGKVGAALDAHVEDNLKNAFTRKVVGQGGEELLPAGIATAEEAIQFAEVPTFSGDLGDATLGGKVHNFTTSSLVFRFVAPFVKASVNLFRYAHAMTPGLNQFSAQARAVMAKGGEEAAALHAKSVMAGSIYVAGFGMFSAGKLTGRGPSDPQLRAVWLQDHQPYSIRVGDKWVSYRKGDPLGTPLGLIADMSTMLIEWGDENDESLEQLPMAFAAALTANLSSKSYLQGVTQFFDAWSSDSPYATKRWIQSFAGSLGMPNAVNVSNPDPYYREVGSVVDAWMARTPGFSSKLMPRYDGFGNPIMKADGLLNRALNPMRFDVASDSPVNEALLELRMGMPPAPKKIIDSTIDLTDKRWAGKDGKIPYVRLQELISGGVDGEPGMEASLKALVTSPEWKDMSKGNSMFPDASERRLRVQAVRSEVQARAMAQVLQEYPDLNDAYEAAHRIRGAAITGGESSIQEVESLFGSPR